MENRDKLRIFAIIIMISAMITLIVSWKKIRSAYDDQNEEDIKYYKKIRILSAIAMMISGTTLALA